MPAAVIATAVLSSIGPGMMGNSHEILTNKPGITCAAKHQFIKYLGTRLFFISIPINLVIYIGRYTAVAMKNIYR